MRTRQLRVAAAPAVDAFSDSGCDESGFVALEEVSDPALSAAEPWPARLSQQAAKTLTELPPHAMEMVRDVLDIVWLG